MKCEESVDECRVESDLVKLDRVLDELGMLSTITDARKDYLGESSIAVMNPRFVTSVQRLMRRTRVKNRFNPYAAPPFRCRTKSETSSESCIKCLSDEAVGECSRSDTLKKCHSLEDLSGEGVQVTPEMDNVSNKIQQLHVNE